MYRNILRKTLFSYSFKRLRTLEGFLKVLCSYKKKGFHYNTPDIVPRTEVGRVLDKTKRVEITHKTLRSSRIVIQSRTKVELRFTLRVETFAFC